MKDSNSVETSLSPAQEKQFKKAMRDLQPKWWDGRLNGDGATRKSVAARTLRDIVSSVRTQNPILDRIMSKTIRIPLKDALALVEKAREVLGLHGDFRVLYHEQVVKMELEIGSPPRGMSINEAPYSTEDKGTPAHWTIEPPE